MTSSIQKNSIGSDQCLSVLKITLNSFKLFFYLGTCFYKNAQKIYKIIIRENPPNKTITKMKRKTQINKL